MDRTQLAQRYFDAWNRRDIEAFMGMLHPQASYYDAFWAERCSGGDLKKYIAASFDVDTREYRIDGEVLSTANGMIARYIALDSVHNGEPVAVYNGAEVFTLSGDRIMTISDYYCDPDAADLLELAELAEQQHALARIAPLGLSAGLSRHISRRLAHLGENSSVYLDPSLTVSKLAERVGCSVMHLFHVLEEERQTTFNRFVNEQRARHATNLLGERPGVAPDFSLIARRSGFDTVTAFHRVFQATFGIAAGEYARRFSSGEDSGA